MLQYKSVIPTTLELLRTLSKNQTLQKFNLVGGTALALHLGHRISIDLDFFTKTDFETEPIIEEIRKTKRIQIIQRKERNSIIMNVEAPDNSNEYVKVDIVKYPYRLINKIISVDGIRLLSIEDIIPMKLSAIANRGAKKDFFDICQLLDSYTMNEMFDFFTIKYPDIEHFHILKSLVYFDDAEEDLNPISLNNTTWEQVKIKIEEKTFEYINQLSNK